MCFPICATRSRTAHFIGTYSNSQRSPICWTAGQMFPQNDRSNEQIWTLLRQSHSESDCVFRLIPVCLVVSVMVFLIVSVLVLHTDTMIMSGSSFKSDSAYKYCLVQSTPSPNPQVNDSRLFKFDSLNPSVLPCRSLRLGIFEKSIDLFESIVIQQTLKVVAVHCHSHILMWIVRHSLCCVCLFESFLTLHQIRFAQPNCQMW